MALILNPHMTTLMAFDVHMEDSIFVPKLISLVTLLIIHTVDVATLSENWWDSYNYLKIFVLF